MKNKYLKRAHVSEVKFRALLKLFSADVPALNTAKLVGLNRNTVQKIYTALRVRLYHLAELESEKLTGEVEVDESYFGARRIRGKRGRGASGKIPVIGLLKRNGRVHTKIVRNCSRKELLPVIKGKVLEETTVYTDSWKSYDGLVLNGYRYYRIHHHRDEFVRGKNHINGIESFWSYTKTRMHKLRGMRKDMFLIHLKESEWRFNHRHQNIYQVLLKELRKYPLN